MPRTSTSNLEESAPVEVATEKTPHAPCLLDPRRVKLATRTGVTIDRTLPHRDIKRIGAWVFLDAYAPTREEKAMQVAAHPQTGLQTVTWLISGTVLHHDSIGSKQTIHASELNLMTAGRGIAHSEVSLDDGGPVQGVKLWVTLPEHARNSAPAFEHFEELPRFDHDGCEVRLFVGEMLGVKSPATTFTPIVSAEINLLSTQVTAPLNPEWEYGTLLIDDTATAGEVNMHKNQLLYTPSGTRDIRLQGNPGTRYILVGGKPFEEKIVMW